MFLGQLSESEKSTFIKFAYLIATKDGEFANEEKQILKQYAIEMDIEFSEDSFVVEEDEDILIEKFKSSSVDIVKKVFIELMGLVLVDKDYNKYEKEILENYAEKHLLDSEYILSVKNWVEQMNELYQDLAELL